MDEDEGLKHFLSLNKKEFAHLFIPTMQSNNLGGHYLNIDATPMQVAENIRIFLENELNRRDKI